MRKVICVFGVGRSGTSVLTEGLHRMGLRISDDLIPASEQNPRGAWEDHEIVALHRSIREELAVTPFQPLPTGWRNTGAYRSGVAQLRKLLAKRFASDDTPFVIKDPSISVFLPMWRAAFNADKYVPTYVLCTRAPKEIMASLINNYSVSAKKAEALWLLRTVSSVVETQARLCVVDYSEIMKQSAAPFDRVLRAAEVSATTNPSLVYEQGLVRDDLNRSALNPTPPANPLTIELHRALTDFRLGKIDGATLYAGAKKVRSTISTFEWWSDDAAKRKARIDRLASKKDEQRSSETVETLQREVVNLRNMLAATEGAVAASHILVAERSKRPRPIRVAERSERPRPKNAVAQTETVRPVPFKPSVWARLPGYFAVLRKSPRTFANKAYLKLKREIGFQSWGGK